MAPLELIRSHPDPAAARAQERNVRSGRLVRVGHGAFVERSAWDATTEWEQHIAVVVAALERAPRLHASHASAVVLHRLPWIGPVPVRATLTDPARSTSQRTRYVDKIGGDRLEHDLVLVEGVQATGLVDTAVDVAVRYDRGRALAVADAVVRRGVPASTLLDRFVDRPRVRAHRRTRAVLELASGASESAGESVAHLVMRDVGCPPPVQQHTFHDAVGAIGRVDFWFPEHGVVVEFDGLAKYRDPALRGGRTAEEVVIAEKLREDRLRALDEVIRVVRPIWRDVLPGGRFPAMLAAAGVPVCRGVSTTPAW
ncbi:hypothetical protein NS263_08555 [Curtobacterium oceanosedimentum]|uniref:Transcriptional regulator, AbiEi antitoxin, Type IV TA system n=1 Tax=Curtobacterium oceanosedimentum TaxID=465820 RepID=A0ABR5S8Z9_9MICO|nr:hypothetical protein [Curtobacterium oceanosedimentum]KTR40125.1 hypothetical protein NS263_08555 [Curtobacterium oceanosedimentum]